MEDDNSWQKLMSLDSNEEDCICSPILYKNKWLLPQWEKLKSSDALLLKRFREESSSSGISQSEGRPQIRKKGSGDEPGSESVNSTPTKRARPYCKRKRLDYSISSPSQKAKPHQIDSSNRLFSENDSCMVAVDVSDSSTSTVDASTRISNRERNGSALVLSEKPRKLLYCLNENIELKSPEKPFSVEELFRAAQLVEEADMLASVKNPRRDNLSLDMVSDGGTTCRGVADGVKGVISASDDLKKITSMPHERKEFISGMSENSKSTICAIDNKKDTFSASDNVNEVTSISNNVSGVISDSDIKEEKISSKDLFIGADSVELDGPLVIESKMASSGPEVTETVFKTPDLPLKKTHSSQSVEFSQSVPNDVLIRVSEHPAQISNPHRVSSPDVSPPIVESSVSCRNIAKNCQKSNVFSEGFTQYFDILLANSKKPSEINGAESLFGKKNGLEINISTKEQSHRKCDTASIIKCCEDTSLENSLDGRIVKDERASDTCEDEPTRVGLGIGASLQLVTGRGKSVAISNTALDKVKSLFGEDFLSIESNICDTNLEEGGLSVWPNEHGGMRSVPGENGGRCSGTSETDANFAVTVDTVVISQQNLVAAESLLGSESRNNIDFGLNEVSVPAYFAGNFKNSVMSDATSDKDMKEKDSKEENAISEVDDHGYLPAEKCHNISPSKDSISEVCHVEPPQFDYTLTCEDFTILHSPPRKNTTEIHFSTTTDIKVPIFEKSSDTVKTLFEGDINGDFLTSLQTNTHSNEKEEIELSGMEEIIIKQKHRSDDFSARQENRNIERIQESDLCEETDMFSENNSSNDCDSSVANVQLCIARGSKIKIFEKDLKKLGFQDRELSNLGSELIDSTSKLPLSPVGGCPVSVSEEKVECLTKEYSDVPHNSLEESINIFSDVLTPQMPSIENNSCNATGSDKVEDPELERGGMESPEPGREDASERPSSRLRHLSMAPSAKSSSIDQAIATGSQHSKVQQSGSISENVNSLGMGSGTEIKNTGMQSDEKFVKSVSFSSANGNRISISEKMIELGKVILKDDAVDSNLSKNNVSEDNSSIIQKEEVKENFVENCYINFVSKVNSPLGKQKSPDSPTRVSVSEPSLEVASASTAYGKNGENSVLPEKTRMRPDERFVNSVKSFSFSKAINGKIPISEKCKASATAHKDDLAESNSRLNDFAEEYFPIIQIPKFDGKFQFSTASGNKISVSNKSLESARALLKDDLSESDSCLNTFNEEDSYITQITKSEGKCKFPTARKSKISVPNERLDSARALLRDDVDESISRLNNPSGEGTILQQHNAEGKFQFSTARGNKISVSNDSLESARALLRDDVDESISRLNNPSGEGTILQQHNAEGKFQFSTARGNKISVSNDSLESARALLRDDVDESISRLNNPSGEGTILQQHNAEGKFQFSTARGNKISVSNDSLESARALLRDDVDESISRLNNPSGEGTILQQHNAEGKFQFSTARGNKISVSNESLESARALLRDDVDESISRLNNPSGEGTILQQHNAEGKFQFSTARGNKISVSNESLESARALLRDDVPESNSYLHHFAEEDSSITQIPKPDGKFQFSTAKGNKISVSNKSLESARTLLKDDVDYLNSRLNNPSGDSILQQHNAEGKFQFSTASGNKILVSNESLESARALLRDDVAESNSVDEGQFQKTVSDSKVSVCDKSLRNSKEIHFSKESHAETSTSEKGMENIRLPSEREAELSFKQNLDEPQDDIEKTSKFKAKPFKFSTAGGDTVSVSEDCLSEVRGLFQENKREFYVPNVQQDDKSCEQFTAGGSIMNISKERLEQVRSNHSGDNSESPSASVNSEDGNLECQVVPEETAGNSSMWEEGGTSVSQITTLLEVEESAVALLADSESPTLVPYLTSPAMFADRCHPSLKPVISWNMEMDEEAALLVAQTAEAALSSTHLKRKSTDTLHSPFEKKLKLMTMSDTDSVDIQEIIQSRKIQREKQEMYIKEKLSKAPVYREGSYLLCRNQGGTTPLQKILVNPVISTHEELLELYDDLREEILEVTSKNAADFKLQTDWFFPDDMCFCKSGLIRLKNGFTLVPADDNSLGVDQVSACFLSHPHVDPALVPPTWVRNHYRWILWKLASLERRFPHHFARKYLTPENILEHLRYRYDRELYRAESPALKKILECDEPSWRRMILCVADITKKETDEGVELELTDGWYSVWTEIDVEMVGLVRRGKLASGDKIVTHGAELNSQDGVDPLQNQSVRLKVHTNSTRRARWDARLGFTKCPGPLPVYLGAVLPRGGALGRLTALVARTYPLLYMAREPQGKTVVRNAQAESYVAAQFEKNHSKLTEKIYEEALKEVEKKYKQGGTKVKYDLKSIKSIRNVDALWRLVSNASDPSELQSLLSEEQRRQVEEYHEFVMSRIRGEVERLAKQRIQEQLPPRRVTVMLKVRLVDPRSDTDALLTIWNPSEDLRQLIKEDKVIEFYSLTASGLRENVLQLSSTKTSRYREVSEWCPERVTDFRRVVTGVSELVVEQSSLRPLFGEMDTVGVVVLVRAPEQPWGVTQVYLADLNLNFLRITFWTSLKSFGWEECVQEGSTVVGVNLHWRSGSGAFLVPSLYASHLTHFSVRATYEHLAAELLKFKKHFDNKSIEEFVKNGKSRLLCLINEKEPGGGTPGTERGRRAIASRLERQFCSPVPLSPVVRPGSLQTGERGTPAGRIKRLSQYGTPTPLPRVALFSSPLVSRSFKSPKLAPPSQLHSV